MVAMVYTIVLSNIKGIPKPIRNKKCYYIKNNITRFALMSRIKLLLVSLPNHNFEGFKKRNKSNPNLVHNKAFLKKYLELTLLW